MKTYRTFFISLLVIALAAVSCKKAETGIYGYLQIETSTLVSTLDTKAEVMGAPVGYNAKQLYVEIVDNDGITVLSTSDYSNDPSFKNAIKLTPGKYTVNVHSYGWDGSDSGFDVPFYTGTATATIKAKELCSVKVTCTLANVKVTVNYDDSFKTYFKMAQATVSSSIEGVAERSFKMGETPKPAYFPAGDLTVLLSVINNNSKTLAQFDKIENVKPREHIKINYSVAAPGTLGGVTVSIDDATRTYNFSLAVPRKPGISFECYKPSPADIWSRFTTIKAEITSKTAEFDANNGSSKIVLQYKEKTSELWNTVENSALTFDGEDTYTYKLTGLTPSTTYQCKVSYPVDDSIESDITEFTTAGETAIYNGGFENWYTNGKIQYPNAEGTSYWDTSNPGSANYIGSVTTQEKSFVHSGSSSVKLATQYAVIKLAAGSIYTGGYKSLISTSGAKLDWGVPFTSRPQSLKGYWSYTPGSINRGTQPSGAGAPAKNANDACQIFCVLLTEQLHVGGNAEKDEYEKSTTLDWENDSRIIAYGELSKNTSSNGAWEEFNIPLKYHRLNEVPKYMAIVCSSSKWGDYFYGSDSSVLYLDDIEFIYGDNPTTK